MQTARVAASSWNWLCTGNDIFPAMLQAIDAATHSVCLETYIYASDELGEKFRDAMIRAAARGAEVRVMADALGSMNVPSSFWHPLRQAGADVRLFNPMLLNRFGVRDHRKLIICDDKVAFIGGFNIASEYNGDGVTCGWCDMGLKIEGALVEQLVHSFDEIFERADLKHKRFVPLRKFNARKEVTAPHEQLLLTGPGRGRNPLKRVLRRDLERARDVQMMVAYFLPTWRLRRQLLRVTQRGGRAQLILAGKSDVALSRLAGQSLYRRFLKAGVEIFEYQPQILHAKLLIIDDIVYLGSANLDQRSLNINFELMIRFEGREMAREAREIFAGARQHCRKITLKDWRKSRSLWGRIKQRWAYFFLVHLDPFIARRQLRALSD